MMKSNEITEGMTQNRENDVLGIYADCVLDVHGEINKTVDDIMAILDIVMGAYSSDRYEVNKESTLFVTDQLLDKARNIKNAAGALESLWREMRAMSEESKRGQSQG